MKKKKLSLIVVIILLLLLNIFSYFSNFSQYDKNVNLNFLLNTDFNNKITLSYGDENSVSGTQTVITPLNTNQQISFIIPSDISWATITFSEDSTSTTTIKGFSISKLWTSEELSYTLTESNNVLLVENESQQVVVAVQDVVNPYVQFKLETSQISGFLQSSKTTNQIKLVGICLMIDIIVLLGVCIIFKNSIIKTLLSNRKLIISLSKNDFKTKYAGSVFGAFWAFVQPIVTIGIYVFVFQIGFKAAPAGQYPFILWLVAGIIAWFFFAESLLAMTSSLVEYSYLVKKVVFDISTLPVVKIISALFIHVFFIVLAAAVFLFMGKPFSLYFLQIFYYLFALICLIFSLSYLVSSITPFFKDFTQIVNILTQIGMWMTPIMWNIDMIPVKYQVIFKFNPMYYIVEGYRDAYLGRSWFWDKPFQSIYFWVVVILLFTISSKLFLKLKDHFSDVL